MSTATTTSGEPLRSAPVAQAPSRPRPNAYGRIKPKLLPAPAPPQRIAVIGSGLGGLTAAYLLSKNGHTVDLYEKGATLGLAAASITLADKSVMDVPMRSFFPEHYAQLTTMYEHLGVNFSVKENSIGFWKRKDDGTETKAFSFQSFKIPFTDYSLSYPNLSPSPRDSFWTVWGYLRFLAVVKYLDLTGMKTVDDWTMKSVWEKSGTTVQFWRDAFGPLFCGVCTCDWETLTNAPARDVLEYAAAAMPFGKMSYVTSGVKNVSEALVAPVSQVFLGTSVTSVKPTPASADGTTGRLTVETSDGTARRYDHVVFATQANQAARILDPTQHAEQVGVLSRFKYVKTMVVTHTDNSLMPENPADWRALNFSTHVDCSTTPSVAPAASAVIPYDPKTTPTCTHVSGEVFQTTNPHTLPAADKTLSTSYFERTVVTMDSRQALRKELPKLQGQQGVWFAGSWAHEGVPLLEGCVASAMTVGRGISNKHAMIVPWRKKASSGDGVAYLSALGGLIYLAYLCWQTGLTSGDFWE
ncbi:hypothetical protein HKX48_001910 [Thoreauomyces humboldtii]|nr:hypothetical protein HKX48_001910 [Thoreauomyces humboldtii]